MPPGNILIAEDDAVLRNLYIKKFALSGYQIRTAQDGEDALQQLRLLPPDVLILDLNMPKVNGLQVLQMLPRATRAFPIIILSNYADENTKQQSMSLGADAYFVKKDMTIKSLVEMAEKLLSFKK